MTNLSARLCGQAEAGQVLVTSRVLAAADDVTQTRPLGQLTLRGFSRPVEVFDVLAVAPEPVGAA